MGQSWNGFVGGKNVNRRPKTTSSSCSDGITRWLPSLGNITISVSGNNCRFVVSKLVKLSDELVHHWKSKIANIFLFYLAIGHEKFIVIPTWNIDIFQFYTFFLKNQICISFSSSNTQFYESWILCFFTFWVFF